MGVYWFRCNELKFQLHVEDDRWPLKTSVKQSNWQTQYRFLSCFWRNELCSVCRAGRRRPLIKEDNPSEEWTRNPWGALEFWLAKVL